MLFDILKNKQKSKIAKIKLTTLYSAILPYPNYKINSINLAEIKH